MRSAFPLNSTYVMTCHIHSEFSLYAQVSWEYTRKCSIIWSHLEGDSSKGHVFSLETWSKLEVDDSRLSAIGLFGRSGMEPEIDTSF